jgi:glycosyltransferase involved in cell wall biosynthesis
MNINWFSNAPWAATGYGVQTKLFAPRLKELGHDIAITAFYGLEGSVINWNGIQIYPRWAHGYGLDIMAAHAKRQKADIVLTLLDAWVFDANSLRAQNVKWVPWFMVDGEPLQLAVYRQIKESFRPICCSLNAQRACKLAGLDALYVPLGTDCSVYKPLGDKQAIRGMMRFPTDKFIVGMVAANKDPGDRKCFFQQIEAFAQFHRKHPDTFLYMHTQHQVQPGVGYAALNLKEYAEYHGLVEESDFGFCDQYCYILGFSDQHMVNTYNAFDVLLNVSRGEGFGVPIVEAQACGTPVIIGDWTAMEDLCFAGWKVGRKEAARSWNGQGSYQFTPTVEAITGRLELAYRTSGKKWPEAAEGVKVYDADYITEHHWKPAIAALQDMLSGQDTELKLVKF